MSTLTPAAAAQLKKFRLRHECRDPVGNWRRSDAAHKPNAAFMALALDPATLENQDSLTAHGLAHAAVRYARQLMELVHDPEKSSVAAAAMLVSQTAAAWIARNRMFNPSDQAEPGHRGGLGSSAGGKGILREAWNSARHSFPQYDERTAGVCFLAVAELGTAGLQRVQSSEILALGACRYAAWSVGDRLRNASPPEEECTGSVLSTIQRWCVWRDEPAMHVPYTGRRGSAALQAMSLARDAAACARLAHDRQDLVPREGAALWQEAAGRHAYAGLAMNPDVAMELEMDVASELATHATRFADRLERCESVVMPIFPPDALFSGANMVRASVRRLLPNAVPAQAAA